MSYSVKVENVPSQSALVVAGEVSVTEVGAAIEKSLGTISAHLERIGMKPMGAPFTRTLSFEGGRIKFESGFPVAKATSANDVLAVTLPAATVATTVHDGPQEASEKAYEALHAWMTTEGKHPAGAPWEVYLDERTMKVFFPIA